MKPVTQQEIIDELAILSKCAIGVSTNGIAERIKAHGIAPPEGWVLVPVVPTAEMLYSADEEASKRGLLSIADITYQAMLSAVKEKDNEQ